MYERHRRWSADGTWQMILGELQIEADAADPDGALDQEQQQRRRPGAEWAVNIDSTSCRARQGSQHRAGAASTRPGRRAPGLR